MDNSEQHQFWNGAAGEQWAAQDDVMARLLAPVSEKLLLSEQLVGAHRILNIGCGGGSDAEHLLEVLQTDATITGVDISEPLLDVARRRLATRPAMSGRVVFAQADAGKDPLGDQLYDLVFSRFGVMFFAEPVRAFAHIRSHCAPGASLLFACWQAPSLNDWVRVPLRAAYSVLRAPSPTPPQLPGPFAFADASYVMTTLQEAGWTEVSMTPEQVTLRWGESDDLHQNARELLKTGPVGRLVVDVDEATRQKVYAAVAESLAPHATNQRLALEGAFWLVTAKNPIEQ